MNKELFKEATVKWSLTYSYDFPKVIELIASGKMDVKKVITKKIKLDHLVQDGLELLGIDKQQAKILVSPK